MSLPPSPFTLHPSSDPAPGAARPSLPGGVVWWLIVLTVLFLGAWGTVAAMLLAAQQRRANDNPVSAAPRQSPPPAADRPNLPAPEFEIVEGPFGRLEIIPIFIAPPEELLWQLRGFSAEYLPAEKTDWQFPNTTPDALADYLARVQLPEAQQLQLRSLAEPKPSIRGLSIRPPKQLVLDLDPRHRAAIYCTLQQHRLNSVHFAAFRCCAESVGEWLDGAALSPATRDLVDPLVYRRGTTLFFSDSPAVAPMLSSDAEYLALIRALSRERTFLVNLKLSAESDIDALVRYWGRGGREREIRPLLESLAGLPNETSLDITHLLPPFARQRLYTYPTPVPGGSPLSHDCHWTATNFFNDPPVEVHGGHLEVLQQNYRRVDGPLQFGDLVLYIGSVTPGQPETIHSAIHLAADVVFTKNGSNCTHPWMLMRRAAMRDYYPIDSGLTEVVFRRKGF